MEVDGDTTTVLVTDLKPSTKYVLTVRASYRGALGEPAATKGKTSKNKFYKELFLFSLSFVHFPPPVTSGVVCLLEERSLDLIFCFSDTAISISAPFLCPQSSRASGHQFPCDRRRTFQPEGGLDTSPRQTGGLQDLHPQG